MPGADPSDQVLLGRSAGEGDGTVKATVVDLSRGGLGVCTPTYYLGVSMASPSDAAPVLESLMSELRRASAEVSR
jgi:predicted polyphosphate/ATP-dependent NAD kinase